MASTKKRKVLSLLMAVVLVFSLLPISALAVETANPTPTVTVAHNGEAVNAGTGDTTITGQKTIAAVPSTTNQFDITLNVTTRSTSTSSVVKGKAVHVVLVIDRSASMANEGRMTSTITAASAFVDEVLGENAAEGNQVAVVSYGMSATRASELTSNAATVKTAIAGLQPGSSSTYEGGTNTQAGLYTAQQLLAADATEGVTKMIVLMSDGLPTYSYLLGGTAELHGNGTIDPSTIQITDRYTQYILGSGNGYTIPGYYLGYGSNSIPQYYSADSVNTDGNLYLRTRNGNGVVKYGSSGLINNSGSANNGFATIWEAGRVKAAGTEIYSIILSSDDTAKYVMRNIATDSDHYKAVDDTAALAKAFTDIANTVTSNANAGIVTDPMSSYVTFNSIQTPVNIGEASTADVAGITMLSWDLSKATPVTSTSISGSKTITTNVYTLTYRVTVNRTEAFYNAVNTSTYADKGVATNGATTLPYTLGDQAGTLTFDVPRVTSEIPTLGYTVEYYKQGNVSAGNYANYTRSDTDAGVASLFTLVSAPAGYAAKYNGGNYHYVYGNPASITVSLTGANIIKLYYDRDITSVTVNHYYKLTTTNRDGTVTEGLYPTDPNTVITNNNVYVGDSYTADLRLTCGGVAYTLDSSEPNNQTIGSLSATASENTINLYYTGEVDNREDVNYSVDHVYRTHTWTLVDGTYQLVDSSATVPNVQTGTQKAHTVYTVTDPQPVVGNEAFTYDVNSVNSITLQENNPNKITLYFDRTIDPRVAIDVTVRHHYTKTVKTIVDGQVQTTVDPNDHIETVTAHKYAGESYTADEANIYNNETYLSDSGNAGKLNVTALNSTNNVIDLYYTLLQEPAQTKVIVNHIYRTITHETVVTTDENSNITGTTVEDRTHVDDSQEVESPSLYVGEAYTASMVGRDGYVFNATESSASLSVAAAADNASIINLYYDKDVEMDDRDAATIDVQHVYTTHLTTIQDGEVTTIDVADGTVTDPTTPGKAGDSFTAPTDLTHNDNSYTVVGTPSLTKILQPGTNSTIVINYERTASDLVEAGYTVNYVYKTYAMTVGTNGVADYYDAPTIEYGSSQNGLGYVGQIISHIPDGARDGFSVEGTNPATTLTLSANGNELTFTYAKYVPLAQVTMTVNHHYSTTTIAVNGTSTTGYSDVSGSPVNYYEGEAFKADAALNGFALDHYAVTDGITADQDEVTKSVTGTASGSVVVDFYYTKTIDNSVSASYSVQHIYKTFDWDGSLINTSSPDPVTGNGYATNPISATPDNQSGAYTLVDATCNNATLASPYTVALVAGQNTIVFTYEKHVDNRTATNVKVIHNYYAKDTYTNPDVSDTDFIAATTPEYTTESVITDIANNAWVGNSYTAEKVPTYTVGTGDSAVTYNYNFVSADPESLAISSLAAVTTESSYPNVITINYVREYSTGSHYSVTHQYYLNGQLVGTVNGGQISAQIGATVNSSDIVRQYTYDGRAYDFSGVTPTSLVIDADATKNVFTLTYGYTTGGGGNDTPVVVIPENPTPEASTPETPVVIQEDPVPEGSIPETTIPEETIPMAEAPKTGDTSAIWIAVASVSGIGLVWFAITNRKRKDETR